MRKKFVGVAAGFALLAAVSPASAAVNLLRQENVDNQPGYTITHFALSSFSAWNVTISRVDLLDGEVFILSPAKKHIVAGYGISQGVSSAPARSRNHTALGIMRVAQAGSGGMKPWEHTMSSKEGGTFEQSPALRPLDERSKRSIEKKIEPFGHTMSSHHVTERTKLKKNTPLGPMIRAR